MMGSWDNPFKISKMDTTLTATAAIRDDLDFPHSGLFRAMGQYAKGCYAIKASATDFDITLADGGDFSTVAVAAGKVFVHNKYVAVSALAATNLNTSYADGGGGTNSDLTPLSGTYVYLMIVYDADAGAIKIRGSSNSGHNNYSGGKIPLFMNNNGDDKPNDVPIAILRQPNDQDDDGHTKIAVQYLTTSLSENSLSVGYANSGNFVEALSISSDADGDIIFEQKVSNKDFTFKMNDGGTTRDVFNLEAETGMSFNQKQIITADRATGWWTIALVEGRTGGSVSGGTSGSDQRAYSKFYIKDESSSRHQLIVFDAIHLFGSNNYIHVYQTGDFSTEVINGIRIKEGATYDGALLQINIADATNNIVVYIQDNYTDKGWQLIDAVADASDPTTGSLGIKYSTAYASWSVAETVTLSNGILQGGARFTNLQVEDIHGPNDVVMTVGSAGVIFNEDGHATNDFRVESDSTTHMLFVDSGENGVAIGTSDNDTNAALTVEGAISLDEISAPTATGDRGKIWTQTDNNMYFQDGAGTNTVLLKGGKHSIWVPAASMYPNTTNGCAALAQVELSNGPELKCLDFDDGTTEYAQFTVAFPKSWNGGTVTFKAYWCSTAADTDGVSWGLRACGMNDNETTNLAFGTAAVVDDANQGAANELLITAESGAVTIAGTPADDDLTFFEIYRATADSNDTAAEDARLLGIKLYYTIDSGNDE